MKLPVAFLFLASVLAAATPAVSQHKLDATAAHWRHVLQLDDWQVIVRAVSIEDLPSGTVGASEALSDFQVMRIYVLQPADYVKSLGKHGNEITRDIEDTIVHELVHLRLQAFRQADGDHLKRAEELVVVRLTNALLGKR